MTARRVNAPGMARLPAFCRAVVAGVGRAGLALGAAVEIDGIAYRPGAETS